MCKLVRDARSEAGGASPRYQSWAAQEPNHFHCNPAKEVGRAALSRTVLRQSASRQSARSRSRAVGARRRALTPRAFATVLLSPLVTTPGRSREWRPAARSHLPRNSWATRYDSRWTTQPSVPNSLFHYKYMQTQQSVLVCQFKSVMFDQKVVISVNLFCVRYVFILHIKL